MTMIRNGLIGAIGGGRGGASSQLSLSDGLACYTASFSGITTTSFSHNLGTTDVLVEFKDSAGNLLVPDNWQAINNNTVSVEFPGLTTGDITVIGCIASGVSAITGGVTTIEGLSGIVDLDSPNGSIVISTSGQVINLNAIFTPTSGALLEQKCRDIDILSGLIQSGGGGAGGVTSINGISGVITLASPNNSIDITVSGQTIQLSGIFTWASGQLLAQKCEDIDTLSGLVTSGTLEERVIYFGKHGADSNHGRNIENAKLTISGAIAAAENITPSARENNPVELVCLDAGLYEETFTIPEWVSVHAPGAFVSGAIGLSNNSAVQFHTVRGDTGAIISKTSASGSAYVDVKCLETVGGAGGLLNFAADSILIAEIDHIELIDGTGVIDASTGEGHTHIQIEDFNIRGTGAALDIITSGAEIVGNVGTIHEHGGAVGTAILMTADGTMNLNIRDIETTVAYSIATGELNLFVNKIGGTQVALPGARACVITPCLVSDFIEGSGVRALNGLSGLVDITSANNGLTVTPVGQTIELSTLFTYTSGQIVEQKTDKAEKEFTSASGLEFVLEHGLQTTSWVSTMWRTDSTPEELLIPHNIYPSGSNHAVVVFRSSDAAPSGYTGRVVFVG